MNHDHQNRMQMETAGIRQPHRPPVPADELKITLGQNFVDITTPPSSNLCNKGTGSRTSSRKGSMRDKCAPTSQAPLPPPPSAANGRGVTSSFYSMESSNFMDTSQFTNMESTSSFFIGRGPPKMSSNCKSSYRKQRHRSGVQSILGATMVRQSLAHTYNMSSMVSSMSGSRYGPQPGTDVMSVPVLGDCNFDQKYSIAMSMDESGNNPAYTPLEKLHALRDVMTGITSKSGYIERATFSQAFEVSGDEFDGYALDNGAIDGNAILIDAVMELEVGAEEKLRFIFETLDPDNTGYVTEDQIVQLLESNFSTARLDMVGTDFKTVAHLMFCKAQVKGESMTFEQFCGVFAPFINNSYNLQQSEPMNTTPVHSKSKLSAYYSANKLRIWWLVVYFVLNNIAFWLKWFAYEVDPAIGWGLRIARANAQVVMINCAFVLLPMCRSIAQVMKRSRFLWRYIPFDDSIAFHKIAGCVLLISGLIHTVAHIINEIYLYLVATPEEVRRSIFVTRQVSSFINGERPPFIIMIQSLPVWTGFILFMITCVSFPLAAIPKLRQGNFNRFWYSHMLFGFFLVVLAFHGAASWLARSSSYIWITPPFLIYLVERRFRYTKLFATPVRIMEAMELDGTVALFMEKPRRFVYRPGMYMFINCPLISLHEWHPFTISSAPKDNYVSVHIRACGDWTQALARVISNCHERKVLYPDVYLDGPVGAPTQDYHRYKTVICVGGGIGVTPFASILKDVVHLWEDNRCPNCSHVRHPGSFKIQKLYFHWVTRGQESLSWFEDTMNQISEMDRDNVIETHQYLSTLKGSENTSQLKMFQAFVHEQTGKDFVSGLNTKQLTHFGRPDWDKVFSEAKANHPREEVGVFYCGPHALEEILDKMCKRYSSSNGTIFDFHSEKFS
ncbi:unnamed protein product [Peronospora belbahrii]|uniref:Calmodulin n=1 Tax=Peronospora belbahrii TaxID=622444 RepID=A0AAU9KSU0_9STRA|nr:unnamed protein product [Peronospora belbahrii]